MSKDTKINKLEVSHNTFLELAQDVKKDDNITDKQKIYDKFKKLAKNVESYDEIITLISEWDKSDDKYTAPYHVYFSGICAGVIENKHLDQDKKLEIKNKVNEFFGTTELTLEQFSSGFAEQSRLAEEKKIFDKVTEYIKGNKVDKAKNPVCRTYEEIKKFLDNRKNSTMSDHTKKMFLGAVTAGITGNNYISDQQKETLIKLAGEIFNTSQNMFENIEDLIADSQKAVGRREMTDILAKNAEENDVEKSDVKSEDGSEKKLSLDTSAIDQSSSEFRELGLDEESSYLESETKESDLGRSISEGVRMSDSSISSDGDKKLDALAKIKDSLKERVSLLSSIEQLSSASTADSSSNKHVSEVSSAGSHDTVVDSLRSPSTSDKIKSGLSSSSSERGNGGSVSEGSSVSNQKSMSNVVQRWIKAFIEKIGKIFKKLKSTKGVGSVPIHNGSIDSKNMNGQEVRPKVKKKIYNKSSEVGATNNKTHNLKRSNSILTEGGRGGQSPNMMRS